MSPEAQRIAIAEACGWKRIREDYDAALRVSHYPYTYWVGVAPINQTEGWDSRTGNEWLLPEYLTDLNAMHEAEKLLSGMNILWDYSDELDRITESVPHFATAAQRAEAFLRTIGKWEEGA